MSIIIKLSNSLFKQLITEHVSLDEIFLLQRAIEGYSLDEFKERKISVLIGKMKRSGLLDEDNGVTAAGKALWESLFNEEDGIKLNKLEKTEDAFDAFWKAYPPTDTIREGDKILFRGERSLKNNPKECKVKFHAILSEGEYTAEDIIRALKYEVELKIRKSKETNTNRMTYMKASQSWLNQRSYESYIEESKIGLESIENHSNITSI